MIDVPLLIPPDVWPPPEFLAVIALLAVVFVAVVVRDRRAPNRTRNAEVIVLAFALAATSGLYAVSVYQAYQLNYSWQFNYHVSIAGNSSDPEWLIVPVPEDETLLGGLQLLHGQANWSLVSTPHGRGLYIRFTGGAELDTYVIMLAPPAPQAPSDPTMTAPSNCTMGTANCTGSPRLWMYYSGIAGAQVGLMTGFLGVRAYPVVGWAMYDTQMFAP